MALAHVHMLVIHAAIYFTNGDPKNFDGEERCCSDSHLDLGQEGVFQCAPGS